MNCRYSWCDRCGRFTPMPVSLRVSTCHQCTVPAPRMLTTAELRAAYERRLDARIVGVA